MTHATNRGTVTLMIALASTSLTLAGCLTDDIAAWQPGDGDAGENAGAEPDDGTKVIERRWTGTIRADGCVEGTVDSCDRWMLKAESHVRWFEVDLAAMPTGATLTVDWSARDELTTDAYLRLECGDEALSPCRGDGDELAQVQGRYAPLLTKAGPLDGMHPDQSLWVVFGIEPRDTPAGPSYPATDLTFTIEASFVVQAGER